MYFEIYSKGQVVKRGTACLNDMSWSNSIMDVPSTSMTLPIEYLEYVSGREEIKIFINDKCFWGIVVGVSVDNNNGTVDLDIDHVVHEWEYRQIAVNQAIKDQNLNIIYQEEETSEDGETTVKDIDPEVKDSLERIYEDKNFAYPGWKLDFSEHAAETSIDYVYSRQTKLDALTKSMELTPDLFWRVGFTNERVIGISEFGEEKPYVLSVKPSGKTNIRIIEEPSVSYDFNNVVNVATVYSEKSDTGMSSMTLREVYNYPLTQYDEFPVVILRANVNNERDYSKYTEQYPKLASNNELEYAVLDTESIALEGGQLIEGTYSFTDLAPFDTDDDEEISDDDRILAAQTAYKAAIRKLKQSRRTFSITVRTEELPSDVNVGDKIRLIYDNSIYHLESCSNYLRKVMEMNDWFYITDIQYEFDSSGMETNELTLCKELKIERED